MASRRHTSGAGDVHVTNNGTIIAGNLGLDLATVSGTVHVFNAGTITGTGGEAITFFNGGGDTLTLAPTSVINGIVNSGGGGDALQLGGTTGIGTFDVSDIGAAQQYRSFDIFNVIGATWILTGTGTQDWNVLGGTLGGTATIGSLTVAGGTVAPGAECRHPVDRQPRGSAAAATVRGRDRRHEPRDRPRPARRHRRGRARRNARSHADQRLQPGARAPSS